MKFVTDLTKNQIYTVFKKLDINRSGLIEFEEFYLIICILIAIKVSLFNQFWLITVL